MSKPNIYHCETIHGVYGVCAYNASEARQACHDRELADGRPLVPVFRTENVGRADLSVWTPGSVLAY